MIRSNGKVVCNRPLNEIWADTQPGIHAVGTRQQNPVGDPDSCPVVTDQALIQAAGRLRGLTAIVSGLACPRKAWQGERAGPAELAQAAALRDFAD